MTLQSFALGRSTPGAGSGNAIQETLDQALTKPSARRVFTHDGCGGWVLFDLQGGWCLHCDAGPLHVGEYGKPTAGP